MSALRSIDDLPVLTPVAIALGSNLGNRAAHLDWAVSRLREFVDGLLVSGYIETPAEGVAAGTPQPDFINAVVAGHTALAPRALLERLLALEAERGRVRSTPGAPRQLDLDVILFGNAVIDEPDFAVPHPRFRGRGFVVKPLAEIVPGWIDPGTGKTIKDLSEPPAPA